MGYPHQNTGQSMKVIKKVFEKISGQKIFSPQISRKKIFNRKIFTYKPGTIQATLMIAFSCVSSYFAVYGKRDVFAFFQYVPEGNIRK